MFINWWSNCQKLSWGQETILFQIAGKLAEYTSESLQKKLDELKSRVDDMYESLYSVQIFGESHAYRYFYTAPKIQP